MRRSAARAGRTLGACLAALLASVSLPLGAGAARVFPDDATRVRVVPIDSLVPPARLPAAVLDDIADAPVRAEDYIVGPGDRLEAVVWGRVNSVQTLLVTPEGDVVVPGAGVLRVGGQTLAAARTRVAAAIRGQLRGSQVDVHLLGVRRFKVYAMGEVEHPQAVRAAATLRASEVIERAGGLLPGAAQRGIELRHADGSRELVDLASFTRAGELAGNPFVREGDVLVVPRRGPSFQIDGAVRNGGYFDLMDGDSLGTALHLAGGPIEEAELERVEHFRFEHGTQTGPFYIDAALPDTRRMPLRDGDRFFVRRDSEHHRNQSVLVVGEVRYAGTYVLRPQETLGELLTRAGGFTAEADTASIQLDRQWLPTPAVDEIASFERLDPVRLRDDDVEMMRLVGAGRLGLVPVDLLRRPAQRGLPLREGDRITVSQSVSQVRISGEVRVPGLQPYRPGFALSDYVRAAGGYTRRADRGHIRVSKANSWHTVDAGDAQPIQAGDVVWVIQKPRSIAWTRVRDTVALLAQAATIYLVLRK